MSEHVPQSREGNEVTRPAWIVLGLLFLLTVVAGWLDPHTGFPLFYAFFGGIGCVLMLFLAKGVGKKLLSRKESYYAAYENTDDEAMHGKGGHH